MSKSKMKTRYSDKKYNSVAKKRQRQKLNPLRTMSEKEKEEKSGIWKEERERKGEREQ